MLETVWLTCPLPHDKNDLYKVSPYRAKRWVYLNPEVVEWRMVQRMRWLAELRQVEPNWTTHDIPWEVEIHSHLPPDSIWGDVDHHCSNLLDTLVGVLYSDDCYVERVVLTRTRDAEEPYCDIFAYSSIP